MSFLLHVRMESIHFMSRGSLHVDRLSVHEVAAVQGFGWNNSGSSNCHYLLCCVKGIMFFCLSHVAILMGVLIIKEVYENYIKSLWMHG